MALVFFFAWESPEHFQLLRLDLEGETNGLASSTSGIIAPVLDLAPFQKLKLRGGFFIAEAQLTAQPLLDPLERAATAQTIIRGNRFHIFLRADLDEREISVSLYHEVAGSRDCRHGSAADIRDRI